MENWKDQLNEWKDELLRPKSNDLLIQIPVDSKKVIQLTTFQEGEIEFVLPQSSPLNSILKEQQNYKKHYGVNTLCLNHLMLKWEYEGKEFSSPIYLFPVQYELDNLHQRIAFSISEDGILNPFLEKLLLHKKNCSLVDILALESLPENWEIQSTTWLGNFHYHRHTILKDIDFYIENDASIDSNLGAFFLGTSLKKGGEEIPSFHQVFPWDEDQKQVIDHLALGENAKVTGPPGTGKSQFIANVAFQHALAGKWVVVSSEKEVAMQVVLDKMAQRNVEDACLFVGNTLYDKTALVRSLQKSWMNLEKFSQTRFKENSLATTYLNRVVAFENKLERLKQIPPTENISAKNWKQQNVEVPDINDWTKSKNQFQEINNLYNQWKGASITASSLGKIRSEIIRSKASLIQLQSELKQSLVQWLELKSAIPPHISLNSMSDLLVLNRLAIHAQILQQALFVQHPDIFAINSKTHKEYKKYSSRWLKIAEQLRQLSTNVKDHSFSSAQWQEMLNILSISKKWSLSYRRNQSQLKKIFDLALFTPEIAKEKIEQQLSFLRLKEELSLNHQALFGLGLRQPESDISLIDTLLIQFQQLEKGLLNSLKEDTAENRKRIADKSNLITQLQRFFERHLNLEDSENIEQTVNAVQEDLAFFILHHQLLSELSQEFPAVFHFVQQANSWETIEQEISMGNLKKFQLLQPELFNYSGLDFSQEIATLLINQTQFFEEEAKLLFVQQATKFNEYHQLLDTPARSLSDEEKQLKKELRSGRSLLIKEFNKQKQHISIRQLLDTDAAHWIRILKPIWMLSPLQIAEVLPNHQEIIDLLIMDEASQIPFVHSLPAIYRSKQLCMVGDEMQMAPTSYFTTGKSEQENLLSRFGYHAPSFVLNYHYRSQHPDLIAFSNHYFYENKLNVFSPVISKASNGMFFHFVEKAIYQDRENTAEARSLLDWIIKSKDSFLPSDTIIIATFSEQQQICIVNLLEKEFSALNSWVEKEILQFKTLENIQGDECDHLIISMGYGKNEEGQFLYHFGPVNQDGGNKRLNVLFSRARKSVHLFSSVRSEDFKLSDNIGVDLLRKYHALMEGVMPLEQSLHTVLDKWKLNYSIVKNVVEIRNPNYSNLTYLNLMTLVSVLEQRAWKVKFTFDKDILISN